MLLTTKNYWDDQPVEIERVILCLAEVGLKVNAEKSFLGRCEHEYLRFWVTWDMIHPLANKVEVIDNLQLPKTVLQVWRFLELVNCYQDVWPRHAHILTPLKSITSENTEFKWTEVEQNSFKDMKRLIGKYALLLYLNLSKYFVIHRDAPKTQLGAVISKMKRPIALYSRKTTPAQTLCTTTERKLLSIVETLK